MQTFFNKPLSNGKQRQRRGFTLTEVMISVAITSVVMASVASLQYVSARTVKEIYEQTNVRATRLRALDVLRYRLSNAQIGTAQVFSGNNRIEFIDPNLGGITSAFFYSGSDDTLYYDRDIDDGDAAVDVVEGPIDVTFELQEAGAVILLKVKTQSHLAGGDVDIQDGETAIYLRNI